ncbi:MAG: 50S ribosomal protein L4 [bacterium]
MAKIELYSEDGKKKSDLTVADAVWNTPVKTALIHQVVRALLSNRRKSIAHTKTRGEVRGGGKKPWKQKGTGRARHGSIRSPLWVGGGVTFGPRNERNFELRITKKAKKAAMRMALSASVSEGKLFALESLTVKEPKTKLLAKIVDAMPLKGDMLVILSGKNENVQLSAKNLGNVWVVRPEAVSIEDIINYRRIAVLADAIPALEKLFGAKA